MRRDVPIRVGTYWQEADYRHTRIVKVLAVGLEKIKIITVSDSHKTSREPRPTLARRDRFKAHCCTSHCGYFQVAEPRSTGEKE